MGIRLLITLLTIPACLWAGVADDAKRSVTRESLAMIKKTFPYQPVANREVATSASSEPDADVVKMEPYMVVDSFQRDLSRKIESTIQKKKDEEFSPIKGGLIYKNDRIEIGTWGNGKGFTFLRFSF